MVVATTDKVNLEETVLLILELAALVALLPDSLIHRPHLLSACTALLAIDTFYKHAAARAL